MKKDFKVGDYVKITAEFGKGHVGKILNIDNQNVNGQVARVQIPNLHDDYGKYLKNLRLATQEEIFLALMENA